MPEFTAARINMVDSQIHTMGVVNESVLDAFRTIRREDFVPPTSRGIAYCDEDLPVAAGRCLMEPVTHARLIQAAAPNAGELVLDIGCATGYSAAILSRLAGRVVALEQDAGLLAAAEQNWLSLGINNVMPHMGPFAEGNPAEGPYDLIMINGTVSEIPTLLIEQLRTGGRIAAVLKSREDKIGRAVLVTKDRDGQARTRVLFDAAVPYLPGLMPRNEFVF